MKDFRPAGLRYGLGDFTALINAISRQEGSMNADGSWNTSSVGYRNNNPTNLGYAGQPGASPVTIYDPVAGTNVTYAAFDTLADGIAAAGRQLSLDASRGLTLAQRIATWSTANHQAYINNVSSWLGVDPSTPLSTIEGTSSPPDFRLVPSQPPAAEQMPRGESISPSDPAD